jgi:AP-2 complex subunit mu-1
MIGLLLILNSRGDIVLSRAFRDGFGIRQLADTFRLEVIATKKVERCPVTVIDKTCFLHLRFDNLLLVACTTMNADASMIFQYMVRLLNIFRVYFEEITEESLRDNFVAVQQVIDESMDYGYPVLTEPDLLRSFITAGTRSDPNRVTRPGGGESNITIKATGNIPWRREGIVYRDNEAYVDVIEDVNLLMSQTGQVLQREVIGRVVMKSFLSGMPECRITINDKSMVDQAAQQRSAVAGASRKADPILLDDVTFHSCVQLGRFDADRSICFVPPDGEFVLMRYRSSENVAPPFTIISARVKEVAKTRMEVDFHLKADLAPKAVASDIVVKVPCPSSTATVKVRVSHGKAKYDATQKAVVWKLKKMQSGQEIPFSCEINLIQSTLQSNERIWSRPPICLEFKLGMVAVSGLEVNSLTINESKLGYKPQRWVRYMSTAGQYQCRL